MVKSPFPIVSAVLLSNETHLDPIILARPSVLAMVFTREGRSAV